VNKELSWINIQIREERKELLDDLKNQKRKRKGKDPSYDDLIDEMLEGSEVKEKKKKKKEERDFMDLF